MILINFSHPFTPAHLARIEELVGEKIERVIEKAPQFDHCFPFAEQTRMLVDSLGLSPVEWQTASIVVNPPSFGIIVATLLADLHGRMGYFPAVVRLRPEEATVPVRFEVAEVINLQAVRDRARRQRF